MKPIWIWLSFALLVHCSSKKEDGAKDVDQTVGAIAVTTKGEAVVEDMEVALVDNGFTEEQAQTVTQAAAGTLAIEGANLVEGIDPDNIEEAAPAIMEKATEALKEVEGIEDELLLKGAGIIGGAVFTSLGDKLEDISKDNQKTLTGVILEKGFNGLDAAGFNDDDLNAQLEGFTKDSMGAFDEAGFVDPSDVDDGNPFVHHAGGVMSAVIAASGKSNSDTEELLASTTAGSFQGLANLGVAEDKIGGLSDQLLESSKESLETYTLQTSALQDRFGALMAGGTKGAGLMGYTSVDSVNSLMDRSFSKLLAGVDEDDIEGYFSALSAGSMDGIAEFIENSEYDVKNIVDNLGTVSVNGMASFGVTDSGLIAKLSDSLSYEVSKGFKGLKKAGVSTTALENMSDSFSDKAMAAMTKQYASLDKEELSKSFASKFTKGLGKGGFSKSLIEKMNAKALDGISRATGLSASSLQAVSNAMYGALEGLQGDCDGVFNPFTQTCESSDDEEDDSSDPISSATGSSTTDNVDCSSKDYTSCEQKEECLWVYRNTNGYTSQFCANREYTKCEDQSTAENCDGIEFCVWANNSTGYSSCIECGSVTSSATCMGTMGCYWDYPKNECLKEMYHSTCETEFTESTCSGRPECYWTAGMCYSNPSAPEPWGCDEVAPGDSSQCYGRNCYFDTYSDICRYP